MKYSYRRKPIIKRCTLVTGHTTVTTGEVYRCSNITKQNNETIHNAVSEASKRDCIIMGDFNHGNIKWDTQQCTGVEDQKLLCNLGEILGKVTIRKCLAHIDGNDYMKYKTATKCWNILRGGLDRAIDIYVPIKKQGKQTV